MREFFARFQYSPEMYQMFLSLTRLVQVQVPFGRAEGIQMRGCCPTVGILRMKPVFMKNSISDAFFPNCVWLLCNAYATSIYLSSFMITNYVI